MNHWPAEQYRLPTDGWKNKQTQRQPEKEREEGKKRGRETLTKKECSSSESERERPAPSRGAGPPPGWQPANPHFGQDVEWLSVPIGGVGGCAIDWRGCECTLADRCLSDMDVDWAISTRSRHERVYRVSNRP